MLSKARKLRGGAPLQAFTHALCIVTALVLTVQPACGLAAEDLSDAAGVQSPVERTAIHGQFTYVNQQTDSFNAPYAGANSLTPSQARETVDVTLYLGGRLWAGAEVWLTPEIDQGFGLDNTVGLAGFSSGEAYKVGKKQPYLRLPRLFARQTIGTGEAVESVDADLMQLAGSRSVDRWVFTIGKFAVTDVFDTNRYAHDARNDFLNWAAIDAGSFDYAADSWGYTVGAAVEWYRGSWTLRAGWFDLSNIPNSPHLDPAGHEFQLDAEIEKRYAVLGAPGRILLTAFDSRGRMGLLDEAVQAAVATETSVNIAAARQFRSRLGVSLDLEQQLLSDLGLFARIGKAAGNVETFEFTDIDRTVSAGLSLKGSFWHRTDDIVGVAAIVNGISAQRERYLNAGGLGVLIGDGKLPHAGPEEIVETYYTLSVVSHAQISLDHQWVKNPAYNKDRGPVSIFAIRVHAQF